MFCSRTFLYLQYLDTRSKTLWRPEDLNHQTFDYTISLQAPWLQRAFYERPFAREASYTRRFWRRKHFYILRHKQKLWHQKPFTPTDICTTRLFHARNAFFHRPDSHHKPFSPTGSYARNTWKQHEYGHLPTPILSNAYTVDRNVFRTATRNKKNKHHGRCV